MGRSIPAINDGRAEFSRLERAVPALTSSRSARIVATIASGWVRTAVTLMIGLVSTPVLLRLLGPERFGAVRVVEQWFAYLEFLGFGLAGAVGVLLVKAATSESSESLGGVLRIGIGLMFRQSLWILPAALILVVVFPALFGLPAGLRAEFYRGAPAVLLAISLRPMIAFRSALEARQRGYFADIGLIAQTTVFTGMAIACAMAGWGLTGQMWATALGLLAFYMTCASLVGAMNREFWSTPAAPLPAGRIWGLQWPLLICGIGNQINILSDNLLAGAVLGVGQVAALLISQRLFQLCTVVGSSLSGGATWAGLVDLRARVGPVAFCERLIEVSKLNVGINLLVLAPVIACNRRFVGLWVGEHYYAGDLVTIATFLQLGLFNFFCLFSALIDSLAQTRKRVWVSTAGTILKLVLLVPAIHWFGLAGLPLASFLACLCTDAWFGPFLMVWEYGVSGRAILAGAGRAFAVGGAWAVVCYLIGTRTQYLLPGWGGLLSEAIALESCGLAVGWFFLLSRVDRQGWVARVRGWIGSVPACEASV